MAEPIRILIDNREKMPLTFPDRIKGKGGCWRQVTTATERLPVADYIHGDDRAVLAVGQNSRDPRKGFVGIERKHSLDELHGGICSGSLGRQIERMAKAFEHPILLYDAAVGDLLTDSPHCHRPGEVVDGLIDLCYTYGVALWFVPCSTAKQRRALGELVARMLGNRR